MWLILAGPGFLGHGASLLWAGAPREGMRAGFYDIIITPGDRSVRKKSDQMVGAQFVGFDARRYAVCKVRRYEQMGTCSDDAAAIRRRL